MKMRTLSAAVLLSIFAFSGIASAADADTPARPNAPVLVSQASQLQIATATPVTLPSLPAGWRLDVPEPRRPAVLPALYAGFVALQAADAYTTSQALRRGATEANPVLGNGQQGRLWAVKAATTAGTVLLVERLWKRNRMAAVLVMVGANGAYAAIAAHNLRQGQ